MIKTNHEQIELYSSRRISDYSMIDYQQHMVHGLYNIAEYLIALVT